MKMEARRISIFLAMAVLAALVNSSAARPDPEPEVNYDDGVLSDAAADDYTLNDGGDEDDDNVDAVITNTGEEFRVGLGKTVRLPCSIQPSPINSDVSYKWDKDGENMFLGSLKLAAPDRVSIDTDTKTDIIISDLQPSDSGRYTCAVLKNKGDSSIVHTIRVEAPPKIQYVNATDNGQVVEGATVRLTCVATGSPPPKVIWTWEGPDGDNHALTEEGYEFTLDSVTIKSVRREQAGRYHCYADNKVGEPDSQTVRLKVLGKPRVHVHKTVVNSAVNVEAILQCSAHDEPPANINWYKDGRRIEDSSKYYSISTHGQRSNLTVTPAGDRDFGTFSCVAENAYGAHNRSVQLVQSPVVEGLDAEGPKLTWTVRSHQPLEEIVLELRGIGEDAPSKTLSVPLPEGRSHEYEIVYVVSDGELGPGRYAAQVNVRNNYDWGRTPETAVVEIDAQPLSIQHASVYHGDSSSLRPATMLLSSFIPYLLIRML